jgi:ABC-type lipoprotein release transport system permease subunit
MEYKLIQFSANSTFVLNAFPVKFEWMDFAVVFVTVLVLGVVASYYPARIAFRQISVEDLQQ